MKIVVIGGTGLIARKMVNNLRHRSQEVVAASPSSGINAFTGEGLAKALTDAKVVQAGSKPAWRTDQEVYVPTRAVCRASCKAERTSQ